MTCILCGGEMHEQETVLCSCEARPLVKVENVPTLVCERCGEKAYSDATVAVLERIRDTPYPSRVEAVAVFDFRHAQHFGVVVVDLPTTGKVQGTTLRQDGTASLPSTVLGMTVVPAAHG